MIAVLLLACVQLLESNLFVRRELAQDMWYDNVQILRASDRESLIADIRARTGLDVHRVDVRQIDFLRDSARLTVYFRAGPGE
jgi:hypothetical protein